MPTKSNCNTGKGVALCGAGPLLHVSGRAKEATELQLREKLGKSQTENICQTLTVRLIVQEGNKW